MTPALALPAQRGSGRLSRRPRNGAADTTQVTGAWEHTASWETWSPRERSACPGSQWLRATSSANSSLSAQGSPPASPRNRFPPCRRWAYRSTAIAAECRRAAPTDSRRAASAQRMVARTMATTAARWASAARHSKATAAPATVPDRVLTSLAADPKESARDWSADRRSPAEIAHSRRRCLPTDSQHSTARQSDSTRPPKGQTVPVGRTERIAC